MLCSEKTTTISIVMPVKHQLLNQLKTFRQNKSKTIRNAAEKMIENLEKRYVLIIL